ncbi:MAG: TonB-dependent receptor, partial [bacterium]|nr:TonB-dependent receptor [bacterium]
QDYYTGKVDYNFGENDRVYGRFMWSRNPQLRSAVFPSDFADPRAGTSDNKHGNATGSWIHHFSPTLIQDLRVNWGRRLHINRSAGRFSNKNGDLGIPGVNPEAFARVAVNGLTTLGSGNHERVQTPIETWQFADTFTWIKGGHQIRFGGEWRFAMNKDDFNQSTGGRFNFGNRATGVGLAELLLGHVGSGQLVDADILLTRTDYYGMFIQDDWRVRSNLTVNLGLRWEIDTPRWEREDNRQSSFDRTQTNPVCDCLGVVTFSGRNGRSRYAHDFDLNNFGPRIGLAWRPAPGWVVRSGYGINYNGMYARAVPFTMFNGFSLSGDFPSPDGGFTQAFLLSDGMPPVEREELGPGFGAVPIGDSPRLSPDFFQQDQRNGMSQQWNFGVQKELAGNMVFEVSYMGNVGHTLGGANVNLNMIPLVNGRGPASQSQSARPFPQFSSVWHESPPWGNSSYHAMNVKLEKRYSGGLNFLINYTYSKFLDDVEAATELGGEQGNGYTHLELRNLDKSFSGNDVRNRFIGSMVYELPFGQGRKFNIQNSVLNAVAGDWGIGLIAEFRDGVPFGVVENTNRSNTFSHGQRPNLLGQPERLDNWRDNVRANTYFDTSLFQSPGTGVFGSAPRNICCGPGFAGIDLSVHKWFNFTERWRLQFRTDFYNLTNTPSFGPPELRNTRGGFGRVSNILVGSNGRLAQLSLRLEF